MALPRARRVLRRELSLAVETELAALARISHKPFLRSTMRSAGTSPTCLVGGPTVTVWPSVEMGGRRGNGPAPGTGG